MLKDIKTKEHRAGAELPKTLRHAPKELARKGLLAAKEKGKEHLLQAAQNGMGGADQAASEESAGAQLLRKTGERGREVASSGGNMLCRAPGRKAAARRAHRLGDQQEHAFSGHGGLPTRRFKEKSPGRPRTQQGTAHDPRAGKHHRKGRTSAGKDAAGNPHGHPANRTRGETGGTAGKAGCKSCAENSKGGRPGAGQYCQSL